jgi:hypothetical protein
MSQPFQQKAGHADPLPAASASMRRKYVYLQEMAARGTRHEAAVAAKKIRKGRGRAASAGGPTNQPASIHPYDLGWSAGRGIRIDLPATELQETILRALESPEPGTATDKN